MELSLFNRRSQSESLLPNSFNSKFCIKMCESSSCNFQLSPQIFLWVLKDNDLTGMAFIDTQLYIHQMISIKNFILAADVMKSICLLRYQEESKTLSLVSRVRMLQAVKSELCQMNRSDSCYVIKGSGADQVFCCF